MHKFLFFFFIAFLTLIKGIAQTPKIDSLLTLLKKDKADTNKVNHLNSLSREYNIIGHYDTSFYYGNAALDLSKKINFLKGIAYSYNSIGVIYADQGNYDKALENYFAALKIDEKIGNKKGIAGSYNNIGEVYRMQGNYYKALENYFTSLKIREEIGDKQGIAASYNNIGNIYWVQGNYDKALENYFACLKIMEEIGNKYAIAMSYSNIGIIYDELGNYDKALENYFLALKINKEIGNKNLLANNYNNIGLIYKVQGKYDKALENYFASLKIDEMIGNKQGIAISYNNIGNLYLKQNKIVEAKKQSLASLSIAEEIGAKEVIKENYQLLSLCDSAIGNWKGAYQYNRLFSEIKDSIFNEEKSKQIAEVSTKYETEKKEKEIELLTKDKKLHSAALKQQALQRNGLIAGFALMLALAGVSYRSYRNKRKAHGLLETKNKIIEEKNKDITDSINYAKNIQQAILPFDYRIAEVLKEHFILFKPRDIVSGDFYFFTEKDNYIFLAVADCTGHGVPGAFMSMISSATLTHAISERGITEPAKILSEANRKIKEALKQTENNNRDGMDISLIRFEKNYINKIQFAGAMRTLYYFNTELNEVQGDKMAIGGTTDDYYQYTNHELTLQKGDTLYIFSDGYADQFGGNDGKKFRTGNFKKLLLSIKDKPMTEQKEILNESFDVWKGNLEQVDDICVIGVRI